ncbi:MAG: hypothetical protein HKO53_02705 [Gemmatimonadetes bacterium]|nr:hypothetical protein [Gemmatimonadota bacterium]
MSTRSRFFSAAVALSLASCLALPALGSAQEEGDAHKDAVRQATQSLRFREIGPTIMSGRVSDLAVDESDPSTFYVGTATGGVWKTENAGVSFEAVFTDQETSSIGDVTLAPSNPRVVWVGTGEPQNRQSSPWGNGVYRSLDGGKSWTHLGLAETRHISRIQVHPSDPDVAYVAAVGHLWGPNPERGVYRTRDGGETWEQVLFIDDDTGAIDLIMDPEDPRTLYAAMYQRRRRAWGFNGGGPGSGIYRTLDGGSTWSELTQGLPEGDKGRIGLDIFRGDTDVVFALVEADPRVPGQGFGGGADDPRNGVYRSTDRGETWEHLSTTNNRPMYYSQIRVDPNDLERIYLGGSSLFRSSDGGQTFTPDAAEGVHLDHHALWIDPSNSDHLILGSDGGVSVSWDRSDNWYQFRNLPISQFYEIGVDMQEPYHVCGGLQDNGSWCAPSDTWSNQGIRTRDWYNVGSGDGFFTVMLPGDPDIMFAESQGGNLIRVNRVTGERTRIRPVARPLPRARSSVDGDALQEAPEDRELRWNWDSPIVLSSHDPGTIYTGANVLFRSTDLGQSWTEISPDLTWAIDRDTLTLMDVPGSEPQMSRNDGQNNYGNLTALAESPVDPEVLYTGSDDGRLHVTRNGGVTWTDVTGDVPGLPPFTYVTRIVASHGSAGTVFAAFDGHRADDFTPYIFRSDDFGDSWRAIVQGLPQSSINALEQHPSTADLLFTGNEVGAYSSIDGGERWVRLDGGLPTVPVDDIVVHPRDNDLVLGTHGRGIWIMDDIGPLEELSDEVMGKSLHLFAPSPALSYNQYRPQGWTPGIYAADNPEAGAWIRYLLAAEGDSTRVRINDGSGQMVRELWGPAEAGMNEVIWDLRLVEEDASGEPMDPGPRVLPGTYQVVVEGPNVSETADVEVRLDPRIEISPGALASRQVLLLDAYRLSHSADAAEDALEAILQSLDELDAQLEEAASPPDQLQADLEAFREEVDSLESALDRATDGAGGLLGQVQGATGDPTSDQQWLLDRGWERLPPVIEDINRALTVRLPELEAAVFTEGARPPVSDPVPLPRRVP